MLIKKENNTVGSAAVIPLSTAHCMHGGSAAFGGQPTFTLKNFVSNDNIYFPGTNPIVYGDHQTFFEDTSSFRNVKQSITNGAYAGIDGGGGYNSINDDIQETINNSNGFKFGFNRIENWQELATYKNPEDAYLNYFCPSSNTAIFFIPTNVSEHYVESAGNIHVHISNTEVGAIPENEVYLWTQGSDFDFPTSDVVISGSEQVLTGIVNNYRSDMQGSPTYTAYYYCRGQHLIERVHREQHSIPIPSAAKCNKLINNLYFYKSDDTQVLNTVYYTSGLTAQIFVNTINDDTFTGDDLYFTFNNTGNNIIGTVHKGARYTSVTADSVQYIESAYNINPTGSYTSYDPSNYRWYNSTGSVENIGGGGQWSYGISASIPAYSNKFINYPQNNIDVTPQASGQYYNITPKDCIPDYFGGTMIFSGNSLDTMFNSQSTQDKYFCIGFKGISPSGLSDFYSTPYYNWSCKLYKFNDEHFKKIGPNTYCFFDDYISKIYNSLDYGDYFGNQTRTLSPVGPFFMNVTGYADNYDPNGVKERNFELTNNNMFNVVPTVLNMVNYVTSAKLETDINSRYLITKPASSIMYGTVTTGSNPNNGREINFGNTDEYSYLAIQYPASIIDRSSIRFTNSLTEITNLGKSMSAISSMLPYGSTLTNLSAIKSSWKNCINLKDATKLFSFSKIASVPDSWEGLSSLYSACDMFKSCTKLTDIPSDLFDCCPNLFNFSGMFMNCSALTSDIGPILDYITSHISASMYWVYGSAFMGCTGVHSGTNDYNQILADTDKLNWYNTLFGIT